MPEGISELSPARPPSVRIPDIPILELAEALAAPDPDKAISQIAAFHFDAANSEVRSYLTRRGNLELTASAARTKHKRLTDEEPKVAPSRTVVTKDTHHPEGFGRKIFGWSAYLVAGAVMVSIAYVTAEWVVAAELFDDITNRWAALPMTGVVLSVGVLAPIVGYFFLDNDQQKKEAANLTVKIALLFGLLWLAMFATVDALDKFNAMELPKHRPVGLWWLLSGLLPSLEAIAKFLLLPTQIAGECAATVAIEIAASRFRQSHRKIVTIPNAYYHDLQLRLQAAAAEAQSLTEGEMRLDVNTELLRDGRELFTTRCKNRFKVLQDECETARRATKHKFVRDYIEGNALAKGS